MFHMRMKNAFPLCPKRKTIERILILSKVNLTVDVHVLENG